jgi:glycosyltransferase involved in cell wall biosynthesis
MRGTLLHAVHSYGLPSEPFVRDVIAEAQALGWSPWVVTSAVSGDIGVLAPERIRVPRLPLPLIDRAATRLRGNHDLVRRRAARGYLTLLSRLPPGVLHAHFGWTGADCALAARELGLPFLVSFHGTDLTVTAHDPEWVPHYRAMLRAADHVTVVSRFLEGRLRALGYTGAVDIVPAGVGLGAFPFTGGPRPGEAPRLLFVGRMLAVKGLDVLLAAMSRLRASGLDATLEAIGEGPLRADLESAARRGGLDGAVAFRGARTHHEVRAALERADIVVVPSRTVPGGQAEGSSQIAKEAGAIGVPIVAADTGGIGEAIAPQLRHELVAGDDPDALATRIARVWDERDRWPERVRMQHDWVASEFAWDKLAARLSAIYDQLLASHPPARARLARAVRRGWEPWEDR